MRLGRCARAWIIRLTTAAASVTTAVASSTNDVISDIGHVHLPSSGRRCPARGHRRTRPHSTRRLRHEMRCHATTTLSRRTRKMTENPQAHDLRISIFQNGLYLVSRGLLPPFGATLAPSHPRQRQRARGPAATPRPRRSPPPRPPQQLEPPRAPGRTSPSCWGCRG